MDFCQALYPSNGHWKSTQTSSTKPTEISVQGGDTNPETETMVHLFDHNVFSQASGAYLEKGAGMMQFNTMLAFDVSAILRPTALRTRAPVCLVNKSLKSR